MLRIGYRVSKSISYSALTRAYDFNLSHFIVITRRGVRRCVASSDEWDQWEGTNLPICSVASLNPMCGTEGRSPLCRCLHWQNLTAKEGSVKPCHLDVCIALGLHLVYSCRIWGFVNCANKWHRLLDCRRQDEIHSKARRSVTDWIWLWLTVAAAALSCTKLLHISPFLPLLPKINKEGNAPYTMELACQMADLATDEWLCCPFDRYGMTLFEPRECFMSSWLFYDNRTGEPTKARPLATQAVQSPRSPLLLLWPLNPSMD